MLRDLVNSLGIFFTVTCCGGIIMTVLILVGVILRDFLNYKNHIGE